MNIYTAEDCGGDLFMVAAWEGLYRERFKELVLDRLEQDGIPEPDRNIQQLDLCEWDEEMFFAWHVPLRPGTPDAPMPVVTNPAQHWKEANYATLYWTYPGVWSETCVTRMPAELAAEFWDGEGVDRSDPKHPDWHDTMAGIWDNREKGES